MAEPLDALADSALPPTREAALARIAAVQPAAYARTRNAIDGAVSGLSPYITHGITSLHEVLAGVAARHALHMQHKFVFELGWRAFFRQVWAQRDSGILQSLHPGLLPDGAYATQLPDDVRQACTGVPVVDQAVHTLYATGLLHNHARMWLASYLVHLRKLHWRTGADWMLGHLLDGDLASNHLSWQWVAGTGSSKPYLFNADNVARYAPAHWHSPGSVVDTSYAALDALARQPQAVPGGNAAHAVAQPPLLATPPADLDLVVPDPAAVAGRTVWLVHPWSLGPLPDGLPAYTLVLGVWPADTHRRWPWSARRFRFVGQRMAALAPLRWWGDAAAIGAALASARSVRSLADPHMAPWLAKWGEVVEQPALFGVVDRRCDSFSQWWTRASRGASDAAILLQPPVRLPR